PNPTLFPYTTLFRSRALIARIEFAPVIQFLFARDDELLDRIARIVPVNQTQVIIIRAEHVALRDALELFALRLGNLSEFVDVMQDRKSTRLNSSHLV